MKYLRRSLLIAGVLALAILVGVYTMRLALPEIVVVNASSSTIEKLVVTLPSSRVEFGPIAPAAEAAIFYSSDQADGEYAYAVYESDSGPALGRCGTVASSDWGKKITLTVERSGAVSCREANKIF